MGEWILQGSGPVLAPSRPKMMRVDELEDKMAISLEQKEASDAFWE